MRYFLTGAILLAFSGSALAEETSTQQQQQQQQSATMGQPAPGQVAGESALPTRTFEGRVKDFTNSTVTLDVAGDSVKVSASKAQTSQLKKGQSVQVQARPTLEAAEVEPVQGAFAGDLLIGTVEAVQNNKITVRTEEGASEQVKVDDRTAQKLQTGQQVVVQLKEDPRKAKDWQATQIKPMSAM